MFNWRENKQKDTEDMTMIGVGQAYIYLMHTEQPSDTCDAYICSDYHRSE